MQTPTSRIALVTGANKGIGFEIARQVGRSGTRVLLGARNPALGQAATATLQGEEIDAHFLYIDFSKPATIQAAAASIEADYGRLDVLVNNAGIAHGSDAPPSRASIDAVRRIFEIIFFGSVNCFASDAAQVGLGAHRRRIQWARLTHAQ